MKDDLMTAFLAEQADTSFANWRWFAADHGERSGTYPEFIGRLARCRQALTRRSIPSTPLPRQENIPSEAMGSHAGNLGGCST